MEDKEEVEGEIVDQNHKDQHPKKRTSFLVADILDIVLGIGALLFYVLFCSFYSGKAPSGINNWAIYWTVVFLTSVPSNTVVFLTSVPSNIVRAVVKRDPNRLPVSQIVLFAFLFPSLYTGQFHPNWVIIFIIPIYHAVVEVIQKWRKSKNS